MTSHPARNDDAELLQALLQQATRLYPDWQNPTRFHEGKSEIVAGLRRLLNGRAPVQARMPPTHPPGSLPPASSPPVMRRPTMSPPQAPPLPASQPLQEPDATQSDALTPNALTPDGGLVLRLAPERFARLINLATAPTRKHYRGGYQDRCRHWCSTIDEQDCTIMLTPDDVAWIVRQITNRNGGGWQWAVAKVFIDSHPCFTGLPAVRRRPKALRRKRKAD
jgi:hypothetical protein